MLTLELITSTGRLRDFHLEWSSFVSQSCPETPFQTPEWLITWWKHFGGGELRVMVFRNEARTVGVMPLFLHEWKSRRQLTLIGSGITDYLDPVFAPEWTTEIVDQIRRELKNWTDWDVCEWQDLSRETPFASFGDAVEDTPCSFIPIEQPFDQFLSSRPRDLKRNLRRYKEKAEAIAPITFEAVETADEPLLDALIELHRARWEKSGQSGMIEANGSANFLRAIAAVFADRGWLTIFALRFGGQITAVILALRNETTIFSYLSAFDPKHETFGFGRELLAQAIHYAHEHCYRRWNFLRGDEPYKFSWGARPVEKRRVVICR